MAGEHGEGRSAVRVPEVDGLRAIAVVSVLGYHALLITPAMYPSTYPLLLHLDFGVMIFFILSGYLIYGPFARAHVVGRDLPDVGRYLLRRATRIYPGYAVAFLVLLALGWIWIGDGPSRFVQHLSLTYSYFPQPHKGFMAVEGLGPSWTLVIEVSFYLMVPAWAWVVRRLARGREPFPAEVAGALVAMTIGVVAAWYALHWDVPRLMLPQYLTPLGLGMLLGVLEAGAIDRDRVARLRLPPAALCWVGAGVVLVALSEIVGDVDVDASPRGMLIDRGMSVLAAALVVVPVVLRPGRAGVASRFLSLPAVRWIGVVSYGVYLWHYALLTEMPVDWPQGSVLTASLGLLARVPIILVVGAASFYLVERPLLKRVSGSRSAPPSDDHVVHIRGLDQLDTDPVTPRA